MNNKHIFLSAVLITNSCLLSDMADLEKQIADKIIHRNVMLEKHKQTYPNENPQPDIFSCCIDSQLVNMQSKAYVDVFKQHLRAQCADATKEALSQAMFKNEQEIVALKRPLLAAYEDHNYTLMKTLAQWNLGAAIALSLLVCRAGNGRGPVVYTIIVAGMVIIDITILIAKAKPLDCLGRSIIVSKTRLYDYMLSKQQKEGSDEQ